MLFLKIETYPSEKLTVKNVLYLHRNFVHVAALKHRLRHMYSNKIGQLLNSNQIFVLKLCILTGSNNLNCYTFTSLLSKI